MGRKLNRILPPLSLTELRTLYSDLSQLTEQSIAEIPKVSSAAPEQRKPSPSSTQKVEKITQELQPPRPQTKSPMTTPPIRTPLHSPLRPTGKSSSSLGMKSSSAPSLPGAPLAEAVVAAARSREVERRAHTHSGTAKPGPKIIRNRLESPQPPRTDDFSRVLPPEVTAAPKLKPLAAGPSPEGASLYSTDSIKRPLN